MGREIDAIGAPDATVLLLVWPRRTRPLIRGATRGEIEAAFPGWTITNVEASHFRLPKILEKILRRTNTGTGFVEHPDSIVS
jgi:hypothetical protein